MPSYSASYPILIFLKNHCLCLKHVEVPRPGIKILYNSDPSHSSDNTTSLTCWATELRYPSLEGSSTVTGTETYGSYSAPLLPASPHLDPGQSLCDPPLKVQFWNFLLLEALYKQSEVVSNSINTTELSLYGQHGNHYQVQPFYTGESILSSLDFAMTSKTGNGLISCTILGIMLFHHVLTQQMFMEQYTCQALS